MTISAPASARANAISRPRPRLAPVISARLPDSPNHSANPIPVLPSQSALVALLKETQGFSFTLQEIQRSIGPELQNGQTKSFWSRLSSGLFTVSLSCCPRCPNSAIDPELLA